MNITKNFDAFNWMIFIVKTNYKENFIKFLIDNKNSFLPKKKSLQWTQRELGDYIIFDFYYSSEIITKLYMCWLSSNISIPKGKPKDDEVVVIDYSGIR